MQSFSFVDMWNSMGWPARSVVVVLAIMSVYSLGVTVERVATFVRARGRSLRFVLELAQSLKKRDRAAALRLAQAAPQPPIARVVAAALAEYEEGLEALHQHGADDTFDFDVVDAVNRALERVKEREIADLRRGLGGLAAVSAGISEALVTTAFGLLVAIPAVMVYNYLTNRVDDFIVDMNDVSSEVLSYVLKEGRPAPGAAQRG